MLELVVAAPTPEDLGRSSNRKSQEFSTASLELAAIARAPSSLTCADLGLGALELASVPRAIAPPIHDTGVEELFNAETLRRRRVSAGTPRSAGGPMLAHALLIRIAHVAYRVASRNGTKPWLWKSSGELRMRATSPNQGMVGFVSPTDTQHLGSRACQHRA